jgi:hypothetical protein
LFGCLQMFIVRILIIGNTQKRHVYTRTERRGNRLGARETERERERVRDGEWLKIELVSVVKWQLESG